MSNFHDIPSTPSGKSASPITIDIPDSPPQSNPFSQHQSDDSRLAFSSNADNNLSAMLALRSPPSEQFHEDVFDIPDIPESPARSPSFVPEVWCDIPDSKPSSPMHIDCIPDSPPHFDAALPQNSQIPPSLPSNPIPPETVDGYKLLPFLPIITSPAARIRNMLADRLTEEAAILTRLDKVRTQIAEVDRQILGLQSLEVMRETADKRGAKHRH